MTELNFDEFLRSGSVGALRVGQSIQEVTDLLGDPDQISNKGFPRILRYGNLQLTFRDGLLSGLTFSLSPTSPPWHKAFHLTGRPPAQGMPSEDFVKRYQKTSGELVEKPSVTLDSQKVLEIKPSGVEALFLDNALEKVYYHVLPGKQQE